MWCFPAGEKSFMTGYILRGIITPLPYKSLLAGYIFMGIVFSTVRYEQESYIEVGFQIFMQGFMNKLQSSKLN